MYRRGIMVLVTRGCTGRSRVSASVRLATAGCVVAVALTGCAGSSRTSRAAGRKPAASELERVGGGSAYTLLQLNLCLSGLAGCGGKRAYPAVVEEAIARIGEAHPDAVTLNEMCQGDVARIARRA